MSQINTKYLTEKQKYCGSIYNVMLEMSISSSSRAGRRHITFEIRIHQQFLQLVVTSIINKVNGEDYGVQKQWHYEPNEFWIAKTKKVIEESATVLLSLQFDGSLEEGIVGFYKAYYANKTK